MNNINVLVLVGNEPLAKKLTYPDGRTEYKGLYYDLWVEMKKGLLNKYRFEETFLENNNDTRVIEVIATGKYDICIAPFTPNYSRLKLVNFTNSIILDSPSILHFRKRTYFTTLYEVIKDVFITPLLLILTVGSLVAVLLYYVDSERWGKLDIKKIHHFRKAFLTVVSSFLSETGFLVETSSLYLYNIILIILILIISTIITVYIQATATNKVIELSKEGIYNRQNIQDRHFVTQTGYDDGEQIKKWGGNVTYEDKQVDEIVKEYLKDPSNYDGIVLDKTESEYYINYYKYRYSNLMISYSDFGFIEECFPVNKNKINFLEDMNLQILNVQTIGFTERMCKEYRNASDINLCVS